MTEQEAKLKVINIAISNIGYKETGNNITKFTTGTWDNSFYGWELNGQPWCDVFVDFCFCEAFGINTGAAMTYQRVGNGSALCSKSAEYYKNNGAWSTTPQQGAQAFFYYNGAINHTGIVESVGTSTFTTIEGNTSDMVARRTYNIGASSVAGFGIPKWSLVVNESNNSTVQQPTEPSPVIVPNPPVQNTPTILKYGSRGEAVRKLQENLTKLGYKCEIDGIFGKETLKNVKAFQKASHLAVDGQAGPLTQKAIEEALKKANFKESSDTTFKKGDKVKIKDGATYYYGGKIPNFVLKDIWIICSTYGDRAIINKNLSGTNSIMSPINVKYLVKCEEEK